MIADNISATLDRIGRAARISGRESKDVQLIAVTKTQPADAIREAIVAGVTVFGENRVQEAAAKIDAIDRSSAKWHLIGHLQSNKARKAVGLFDVIQSLDSIELADRLERICIELQRNDLPVMIQADLAGETTKTGLAESGIASVVEHLSNCERLRLIGFMTVPPFFEDAGLTRPYFIKLREIRDLYLPGGELSMGMSHDLEVAIEEGSTMVRVGTALFGDRG